jgi:hypothetical protein
MVFFHRPAFWPGWLVWLLSIVLAAFSALLWLLISRSKPVSLTAGLILWLFMASDGLLLLLLPRRRISFGPWKAQLFTLALPRMVVTILLSLLGRFDGQWGISSLFFLHLVGSVAFIWGAFVEPFRLKLTRCDLATDRMPPGAPPIRLLHISDLHVERLTQREERLLQLVKQARPDLILITGDYVNLSFNRDPSTHAQVKQLLSQLTAPYGVYATLGSPPVDLRDSVAAIFEGLPIQLMREQWAEVDLGEGRKLVLLGLDCTHHIPTDAARFKSLMAVAPNSVPQALLYHSPELMPQATDHGIDLYLCGHTHGGQVRLPFIGPILTSSQLGRKYVMGLYRHGRTHLYVSRGVGLEGLSAPRVRFLSPPEVTLLTLQAPGEPRNLDR